MDGPNTWTMTRNGSRGIRLLRNPCFRENGNDSSAGPTSVGLTQPQDTSASEPPSSCPPRAPLGPVHALGNQTLMNRAGQNRVAGVTELIAEVLTGETDGTRARGEKRKNSATPGKRSLLRCSWTRGWLKWSLGKVAGCKEGTPQRRNSDGLAGLDGRHHCTHLLVSGLAGDTRRPSSGLSSCCCNAWATAWTPERPPSRRHRRKAVQTVRSSRCPPQFPAPGAGGLNPVGLGQGVQPLAHQCRNEFPGDAAVKQPRQLASGSKGGGHGLAWGTWGCSEQGTRPEPRLCPAGAL